jgi:hypothetical protein
MKKYLLLIILFPIVGMGQSYSNPYTPPQQVNVTVKKDPNDFSTSFTQGMQAGAAVQQAAAANRAASANAAAANAQNNAVYNEAIKDNYSKISVDNLINNSNNYDYVVLESVSGWRPQGNKEGVLETLIGAKKYEIIDLSTDYKSNGKEIENEKTLPLELKNNPKVLFVSWLREAQGEVIRITKLTVKNFEGKLVYESTSKNLSHQEILKPLISNYSFTKEMALSKIEELKKYFDLGVITKEEYDLKVAELKPILLGDN